MNAFDILRYRKNKRRRRNNNNNSYNKNINSNNNNDKIRTTSGILFAHNELKTWHLFRILKQIYAFESEK